MKKTIIAASAALTLIASSAALAQQGGGRMTFENFDADGDGIITKEEFKANFNPPERDDRKPDPERVFGRWDADGNGEISAEEFENRPRPQQQ